MIEWFYHGGLFWISTLSMTSVALDPLWVSGRHPHSLRLWAYEDVQVLLRCFFYLPSKCDRSYWLYLWHTTSSMKLHFAHFFPMLTFPWRNSRALIVTDANTRSFFHGGSGEHAHRLHVVHKNKSLSTNLNRKLPRLSDLCFYKLHYTDSKLLPRRTSFSMFYRRHRHDSCARFTRVRCNVCYSHLKIAV